MNIIWSMDALILLMTVLYDSIKKYDADIEHVLGNPETRIGKINLIGLVRFRLREFLV